jgi:aarF domain-containing kinase
MPVRLPSIFVPSSQHLRSLAVTGLAASEILRRSTTSDADTTQSVMMTEANMTRLVFKLSQMHGAALRPWQFMSIQGAYSSFMVVLFLSLTRDARHPHLPCRQNLPPRLRRRTLHARLQMQRVLQTSPGETWADDCISFDRILFAAASIDQVHHAVLAPSQSPSGGSGQRVAVKIHFPNIANSIASDLGYAKTRLTAGSLLPRGLFLDCTIQVCSL